MVHKGEKESGEQRQNNMNRKLIAVVLALALTATGVAAKKRQAKKSAKDETAVTRYLLMTEGAIRTGGTEAQKDGEPIWTSVNTTTILPPEIIEYIPVIPKRTVRKIELPGGEIRESDVTRFQCIKSAISCRFAYAVEDGERVMDECQFIELEGPVKLNRSWEFKATRLEPEPAIATGLTYDYTARVSRTGMNFTIRNIRHTECLAVTTIGLATAEGTDTCADGTTATGTLETTSTRWFCPGIGAIKEVTTVRLQSGGKLCTEYLYKELMKTIKIGE